MSRDFPDRVTLLRDIDRATRQVSGQGIFFHQAAADRLGMNPTDLECLGLLGEAGPMPAGHLTERTGLTTGAITGVVDRLEQAGYARREKDPTDRRRVIVQVVQDKVEQNIKPVFASLRDATAAKLAHYSDQELALILDFLERTGPVLRDETVKLREETASDQGKSGNSSARLVSPTSGRFIVTSGAAWLNLRADSSMTDLYRARFEGSLPDVQVADNTVTINYRHFPFDWRKRAGDVILNGSIPWRFELHGGASRITADLSGLRKIEGFDLSGGANKATITLPRPTGIVSVHAEGGISKITLNRPRGVDARVDLSGGASKFIIDGERIRGVGDGSSWQTPQYDQAIDRYDVSIEGGLNSLTFDTY